MKVIKTISELKLLLRDENGSIGFVPTMGALHLGHVSLIDEASRVNDVVVVSIFVNPTQFLEGEDLDKYPKKELADKKICEVAKVDYLFYPDASEIYKDDEVTLNAPNIRGYILEGESRPGHFSGVLTVVNKLFNIVNPTRAYFGKKDAQQLMLIKTMVKNLFMDVEIIECETMRDENGLALSSRNVYLSKDEYQKALAIPNALKVATKMITKSKLEISALKDEMYKTLKDTDEITYVQILKRDFTAIEKVDVKNSIILIEAVVGGTRLLDNVYV